MKIRLYLACTRGLRPMLETTPPQAHDKILGVPGPKRFWLPWRMTQKWIFRKTFQQSTISEKVEGIVHFAIPPSSLSGRLHHHNANQSSAAAELTKSKNKRKIKTYTHIFLGMVMSLFACTPSTLCHFLSLILGTLSHLTPVSGL